MLVERSSCRCGPLSVDLRLVCSALNACFNVEAWASMACGGRIYIPAARTVGFNLIGERVRAWLAMPSIPEWDPS